MKRSAGRRSARAGSVHVFLVLGDEDRGAGVPQLILDLARRGGRIDAVGDGAERLRAEVGQHPLLAGIPHDGDAVAPRHAEPLQAGGHPGDQDGIVAPGTLAIEAEVLGAKGDRARPGPRVTDEQS